MTDKPHMTLPNGDKLFEGDYGRTRDGEKVGPAIFDDDDRAGIPWCLPNGRVDHWYSVDGKSRLANRMDIIAKWTEAPAQAETGTLAQLNVKPGDVVELVSHLKGLWVGTVADIDKDGWAVGRTEDRFFRPDSDEYFKRVWRIVSRASDAPKPEAPKLWRDMTPEEKVSVPESVMNDPSNPMRIPWGEWSSVAKGLCLLAHHEGKVIQSYWGGWQDRVDPPPWKNAAAHRILPEPKRETVAICYRAAHGQWREIGTIDLIDGKPARDSVKIEVGDV